MIQTLWKSVFSNLINNGYKQPRGCVSNIFLLFPQIPSSKLKAVTLHYVSTEFLNLKTLYYTPIILFVPNNVRSKSVRDPRKEALNPRTRRRLKTFFSHLDIGSESAEEQREQPSLPVLWLTQGHRGFFL